MDVKKVIFRTTVVLVFGLMLITAIIFLLASSVPSHYTPMQMTKMQREDAAAELVQRSVELLNNYQKPEPFTHVIKEEELNRYLSSLEEIAHLRLPRKGKENVRAGKVKNAMDEAGVADPWIHLSDGTVTLMVRTENLMKVISLEISFSFPDEKHLSVHLEGVSIGRMPVPQFIVNNSLSILKDSLPDPSQMGGYSFRDFDLLLARIVRGIDGEPMSTTLNFHKRIRRIHRIEIDEGEMRIEFVPVLDNKPEKEPATQPAV